MDGDLGQHGWCEIPRRERRQQRDATLELERR